MTNIQHMFPIYCAIVGIAVDKGMLRYGAPVGTVEWVALIEASDTLFLLEARLQKLARGLYW